MTPKMVFVLGTTRSGTSALRNALCQTRYKGPGEGHFIGLVKTIDDEIHRYYLGRAAALVGGTMLSKVSMEDIRNRLFALFSDLYKETSASEYVVDKTPTIEPLIALDTIQASWPDARFIFCRRRGIDNVLSKQRKFPNDAFINHCREWSAVIDYWDAHKLGIKADWIEVDYYDLSTRPDSTATRIAGLLGLTNAEEKDMLQYLLSERPEQTSNKRDCTRLSDTGWDPDQVTAFLDNCGKTMIRCGYGLDSYWQTIQSAK